MIPTSTPDTDPADPALPPAARLRELEELPGPRGIPVLGNALQIRKRHLVHQTMEKWSREFGDYYLVKIGARRVLAVADHQAFAKILRDRPEGFSRTSRLAETWEDMGLQPGLFGANGDLWKRQRRMVMAGFDPAHVKHYFPSLCKVADKLEARWSAASGSDIDLQADLMRFTVDAITGLAFGHDVNTLESGEDVIQRHLDKIFPAVFRRNLSVFRYWKYFKLPADRELDRSVAEVNQAIRGFIAGARERIAANPGLRERPDNLLEAMINAADQGDSGLSDQDVAGNVVTMLLAGEDTTANSLAWLLALAWEHPDVLNRLQQEVRDHFSPDSPYTMAALDQLEFMDACINESMRLKPVAPLMPLQAVRDTVVGDIRVPAGTPIFGIARRDSMDERYIPDGARFDPQRWMGQHAPAQGINSVKRVSMPFGAGPRICPGRYLALLEMKVCLSMLFSRFDIVSITTPDGQPAQEYMAFTMAPLGLRMRLARRRTGS